MYVCMYMHYVNMILEQQNVYICMYARMYVYVYVYMYACVYVCAIMVDRHVHTC